MEDERSFGYSQEKRKCKICDPRKRNGKPSENGGEKIEKKMIEKREINEFVQNIVLLYWSFALPPLNLSACKLLLFSLHIVLCWTILIFFFRGILFAIVIVLYSVAHRTSIKVLNCFVKYLCTPGNIAKVFSAGVLNT